MLVSCSGVELSKNIMGTWTLILFFGRGKQSVATGLTKEAVQEQIRVAVFSNLDCINFSCFRDDK